MDVGDSEKEKKRTIKKYHNGKKMTFSGTNSFNTSNNTFISTFGFQFMNISLIFLLDEGSDVTLTLH